MSAPHPNDVAVPVPYFSRLSAALSAGQTLIVHGNVNSEAQRFELNLLQGSSDISPNIGSVALHISVRFDEKKIVFNSMQGGEWGKEERESNPFHVGQEFDLRIRAHDDKFEIFANQKEVHEFKYRIPIASIDFFNIKGDVSLRGVHWGGRYYTLPLEAAFAGGFIPSGGRIYVYGIPKGERFNIDFLAHNGEALFHFNPRFGDKQIVRNSQNGGNWGNEEREGPFPFKKDVGFDLAIHNETFSIQIFVNGERIGTFAHRTQNPAQDYAGFRIAGDLELTGLEFSGNNH